MTTTANATTFLTMADWASRTDPDGTIAEIVEALSKETPLLQDASFIQGNLPDGHKFTSRTGLPTVGSRRFNEGVAPGKSVTSQITETAMKIAAMSAVDVEEAKLNGDSAAFRATEDSGFTEALQQYAEKQLIYGADSTDPTVFTGLLSRLNSTTGPAGKQIILHDGSASGNDQTSMLLVGWGPKTVSGMFPKGSVAGLSMKDMGEQLWDPNNDGHKFVAYVTAWNWDLGLVVKDKRYLAAIRNIDMSDISATGNLLIQSAIKAYHKIYRPSAVRPAWYCNRDTATYLHLQALDSTKQSTLRIENVAGAPVVYLLGAPVRITDTITSTESVVS